MTLRTTKNNTDGPHQRPHTLQHAKNKNTELPHQNQPYASCNAQVPQRLSTFPHQKQLYTHACVRKLRDIRKNILICPENF